MPLDAILPLTGTTLSDIDKNLPPSPQTRGRFLAASVKRARVRGILYAMIAVSSVMAAPLVAMATTVTATLTGTVSSGTDYSGIFGPANTSLAGKAFTLTYTFNDAVGTQSVRICNAALGPCQSGIVSSSTPGATAVLQIGSGHWTFGGFPVTSGSSSAQRTIEPNLYSELIFSISEFYAGGSDAVNVQVYPSTGSPPLTMNYNWEGSFTRSSQVTAGSTQFGINDQQNNVLYEAGGSFNITGVTISGPLWADATVAKALGAASDIPCACQGVSPLGGSGDAGKPVGEVAEPITVGNGNMFEQVADYTTVGPNPLRLTRYYNSFGNAPSMVTYASSLGTNWRSNYDRYLRISPATGTPTMVSAERADGQILTFHSSGSAWVGDTDADITLTEAGSSWTLKDHDDTVETYASDSSGKGTLDTITARDGYTQTLSYSGGLLSSVTDSYGRSLRFTYSGALLENVTTPDTLTLTYGYTAVNGGSQLTSVAYNTGTSQKYVYEDSSYPFALTGIVDENGNRTSTWTYDAFGNAATSQRGEGANLTTMAYNSVGTTTVTNALGVADTYSFATLQNVLKIIEIDRATTSTTTLAHRYFTYDANGYLASSTDWNGNSTTYVNNSHGQPTTINEAAGSTVARTTTISYDPAFAHLPHQIVTPGLTSTFAYDSSGNLLTRTDADTTTNIVPYSTNGQTRVTTYTWSSTGQETSVKLPRTDVTAKTTFAYDSTGALTTITDALGHKTQITSHTGGGLPLIIVDPNNVTTTLAYDGRLNLYASTLKTTSGNLVTTFTHDPANQLTAVQLPDNSKLTYGYDTAHRMTSITDLLGNSISYTLDALGDKTLTQVKNPSNAVTQSHSATFDALGRVLHDVGGMGQTTVSTYDNNSNLLTVTPPSPSAEVLYTYDALNRRSTARDSVGTTTFTYDAHDQLLGVKNANGYTTTYVNNGFSDRTQEVSPDRGTSVYTWDPDRNLTQQLLAGSLTANMTYDALDRNLTVTYPGDGTLNVSRTWDQAGHGFGTGRLTSATDQVGSLGLTYDDRGNVTAQSRAVTGAGTLNTDTTYDAAGRVSGIAYPSGSMVVYTRDSMGRVTSVMAQPAGVGSASKVASAITYEPFGPIAGLSFGNGITGTYGYDLDYRPTTRVDMGTSAVQNLTYGYFANNSVNTITDAVNVANTQTFAVDAIDRLTSATSGGGGYGSYSWTWDPVGNLVHQVINGTTTAYSLVSGSNKLSQWVTGNTTETVGSTAAGNINTLKIGSTTLQTLTYNQANQLASATGTSTAVYKYALDGQRLLKSVAGSNPVLYQYGQAKELLSENDLHKGQAADYIYLNDTPIGEINPTTGALYFTHTDRLGTPQKLTDASKNVVWSATYQPFGNTVLFSGSLMTQSLRLPGQYFDPETGYNHNGFRDYAASMTRYVESDPIGLAGGMNTFQYAKGNPFKYVDPNGLDQTNWDNTQGGRNILSGPTNGNWGGKCWSGGQYSCTPNGITGTAAPTDSGDQCYKQHDLCWNTAYYCSTNDATEAQQKAACNRDLVECLNSLPNDSTKWVHPPRPGTEGDSERYRDRAKLIFGN